MTEIPDPLTPDHDRHPANPANPPEDDVRAALDAQAERHAARTAALRREVSEARTWAWSLTHRTRDHGWFPRSWVPGDDEESWTLPTWLTCSQQPHLQPWWVPPGPIVHVDATTFAASDLDSIDLPTEVAVEVGDVIYLSDGSGYRPVHVIGLNGRTATLAQPHRGGPDELPPAKR